MYLVQIEPKNGFETEKVKDGWISTPAPHVSLLGMRCITQGGYIMCYGVAMNSRLLKIIGQFCKRAL